MWEEAAPSTYTLQAVKQVPWMQEGAVRARFQPRLFVSSWVSEPCSVFPISFLHLLGPRRRSSIRLSDNLFTLSSLSFSVELDTTATVKQASWKYVSLPQPLIYFQYKVILLKLVHWREEEYMCHFVSSMANRERNTWLCDWGLLVSLSSSS